MICKKKSIISLVLVLALTLGIASFGLDLDETGSLSIMLKDSSSKENLKEFEFVIYKVADAVIVDNNLAYEYTKEFVAKGEELDLDKAELAENLYLYALEQNIKGQALKTEDSKIFFDNLAPAVYLVSQKGEVEGYYPTSSFLVSLPIYAEGQWVYDIDASPKVQVKPKVEPPKPDSTPTPKPTPPLISTGQLKWPIPVLSLLGLVLFSLGWVKSRRSGDEGNEA